MGSDTSKVGGSQITPDRQITDKYLGKGQLFTVSNRKRSVIKSECKSNLKDYHAHIKLNHKNLSKIWNYDSDLSEVFGFQTAGTSFYFDYYETSLEYIISARKNRAQYFSHSEVKQIGSELLDLLAYLQWNTVAHWDIFPASIFYDRNLRHVVSYDNELIYGKYVQYRKILSKIPCYCTPESLQAVRTHNVAPLDQYKYQGDIYSLGLLLLEIGTLKSSYDLVNTQSLQMDQEEIGKRLDIIKKKYGPGISDPMYQMLHPNPALRPAAKELKLVWDKATEPEPEKAPAIVVPQPRIRSYSPSQVVVTEVPVRQVLPAFSPLKASGLTTSQVLASRKPFMSNAVTVPFGTPKRTSQF